MIYSVTIRAFDRVSTRRVHAESEDEARERALADVHFKVDVREAGTAEQALAEARRGEAS